MDTSGIEPDTSRMLSERDKPTTPCALVTFPGFQVYNGPGARAPPQRFFGLWVLGASNAKQC
jgi:hypothetical protein